MASFATDKKVNQALGESIATHSSGNSPSTVGGVASRAAASTLQYVHKQRIKVESFYKDFAADADLAFGQKIWSMPAGAFIPVYVNYEITLTADDGLGMAVASDDGEMALGTVVASGAVDELGGTATFEDIVAAPIALTALTKSGIDTNLEYHKSKGSFTVLDGTSTAKDIFLNICGTWDYTASSGTTLVVSGYVDLAYLWLGDD